MNKALRIVFAISILCPLLAAAQAFPNKPIRLIVTFPPGGATDVMARGLSVPLAKALGQPIVVDNRPGANAIIGMEACARSAPDGYNYCMTNNDAIAFNPALYAKLPYDPAKDLVAIAKVGDIEQIIVAHSSVAGTTLKQVIEESSRSVMTFSTFGNGSMGHLYVEWLNHNAGAKLVHVPYKGAGPALEAVFKGETKLSMFAVGAALPHLKNRTIKAVAFVDTKRSRHLPDVPTITEQGYDFVVRAWLGVFAPRGIPGEIAQRMNRDISTALTDPEFRQKFLAEQAIDAAPNSMEQFAEFIRADAVVAGTQLRAANIRLD